jgi:hypothetical protein
MDIKFGYGCLCEPLEIQANLQGYTLGSNAECLQKECDAISLLKFDVLTDSQHHKILNKFHKNVIKSLRKLKIKNCHALGV